jgi:NitT/TauT family transport system substrate-binding protein
MKRQIFLTASAAAPFALVGPHTVLAQGTSPAVRVGCAVGDPFAQGYYAVEGGYFQKGGLNVDFRTFTSGAPIGQGVVTGDLDIGIMTPLAVASAVTHGVPLVIVAAGGVNGPKAPSGWTLVSKSSPLRAAKDFEGKTFALASLRTVHELMIHTWLVQNNVDPAKVRLIEMTFGEMGPALERGTVDAVVQVEPLTSGLVRTDKVRIVEGPNSAIPEFLGACWFSTVDYARKNPDVVRRFANIMGEVARWANTHQRESGEILAKVGKLDPEAVRGMVRCSYADSLKVAQVQPLLDLATKAGILNRRVAASELLMRA